MRFLVEMFSFKTIDPTSLQCYLPSMLTIRAEQIGEVLSLKKKKKEMESSNTAYWS